MRSQQLWQSISYLPIKLLLSGGIIRDLEGRISQKGLGGKYISAGKTLKEMVTAGVRGCQSKEETHRREFRNLQNCFEGVGCPSTNPGE